MRLNQTSNQNGSPAEQLLANVDFRLKSFQDMVQHAVDGRGSEASQDAITPLERRSQIIKNRRAILQGATDGEQREEEFEEEDEFSDLPDNVHLTTDEPDEEQIAIAHENAEDFKRIVVMEGGKVKGIGHGRGGPVVLREFQDQEYTIEKELVGSGDVEARNAPKEERKSKGESDTMPGRLPSMSAAAASKQGMKAQARK